MRSLLLLCTFLALTSIIPVKAQTADSTWSMRGSFQLSVNGYNGFEIPNRREPLRYTASFRPVFVKNSWRIPVEVLLFNVGIGSDFQFMRFGIHPSWSWGKLHLGHTNMNLSKFTLSGRTLFGVGAELNPGLLRFAGFLGTSNQSPTSFLTNDTDPQAFQQNIYTFKIGVGTRNNFVDLLFLSGRDVQETVDSSRIILDQYLFRFLNRFFKNCSLPVS